MATLRDTLTEGLQSRLSAALAALDADAVLAWVDYTVKARTLRGAWLDGSTADGYSPAYARRRERVGLQTAVVDLNVTARMLDATRAAAQAFEDQVRMEYGYIEGLSDAEATRIAEYHNVLGAGRSRKLRRFVGLTGDERAEAIEMLRRLLLEAL